MQTDYGTRSEEFTEMIESGPPYIVRYHWGGGPDSRERQLVTEALAACFGLNTLGPHQRVNEKAQTGEPLANRVRYAFWLLKIFEMSLGFTHGWENGGRASEGRTPVPGEAYRISLRVDRSRYREVYDEY